MIFRYCLFCRKFEIELSCRFVKFYVVNRLLRFCRQERNVTRTRRHAYQRTTFYSHTADPDRQNRPKNVKAIFVLYFSTRLCRNVLQQFKNIIDNIESRQNESRVFVFCNLPSLNRDVEFIIEIRRTVFYFLCINTICGNFVTRKKTSVSMGFRILNYPRLALNMCYCY